MSFNRIGSVASIVLTLALLLPVAAIAEETAGETAQAAPTPAAGSEPTAPATPAKATGEFGMNYTPTAGVCRDKLIAARKNVLKATASLDEVNAEYARVLYEHPDDSKQATHLAKQRAQARQQLGEAKSVIPVLVEKARADGVSERVLELYEQSLED